jgi:hypothetical protein
MVKISSPHTETAGDSRVIDRLIFVSAVKKDTDEEADTVAVHYASNICVLIPTRKVATQGDWLEFW